jgi:hypothetical protein
MEAHERHRLRRIAIRYRRHSSSADCSDTCNTGMWAWMLGFAVGNGSIASRLRFFSHHQDESILNQDSKGRMFRFMTLILMLAVLQCALIMLLVPPTQLLVQVSDVPSTDDVYYEFSRCVSVQGGSLLIYRDFMSAWFVLFLVYCLAVRVTTMQTPYTEAYRFIAIAFGAGIVFEIVGLFLSSTAPHSVFTTDIRNVMTCGVAPSTTLATVFVPLFYTQYEQRKKNNKAKARMTSLAMWELQQRSQKQMPAPALSRSQNSSFSQLTRGNALTGVPKQTYASVGHDNMPQSASGTVDCATTTAASIDAIANRQGNRGAQILGSTLPSIAENLFTRTRRLGRSHRFLLEAAGGPSASVYSARSPAATSTRSSAHSYSTR